MTTGRSGTFRRAAARGLVLAVAWACLLAAPVAAHADALVGPLPSPVPTTFVVPSAEATAAPSATATAASGGGGGSGGGTVALAVAGVAVVAAAIGAFFALRGLTARRGAGRPAADGRQRGEAAPSPDDEAGR